MQWITTPSCSSQREPNRSLLREGQGGREGGEREKREEWRCHDLSHLQTEAAACRTMERREREYYSGPFDVVDLSPYIGGRTSRLRSLRSSRGPCKSSPGERGCSRIPRRETDRTAGYWWWPWSLGSVISPAP